MPMQAVTPASGWRRVAAYLIDYLVIAAYIALLTGASFASGASRWLDLALSGNPALGQLVAFVALTLPVTLYFAVSEASPWQGTLGKRALKLRVAAHGAGVRLSFRRALLRAALKFAPWELAHTVLWRVEGWPLESPQPTPIHWLGFALSLLWAGWYLLSLFVGSQRTLYDRAAASVVVRSS